MLTEHFACAMHYECDYCHARLKTLNDALKHIRLAHMCTVGTQYEVPDSNVPTSLDDDVQLLSDEQTTVSESRALSEMAVGVIAGIPNTKAPQRLSLKETTKATPRQRSTAGGIPKNANKSIEHNGQTYIYYEHCGDQVKYRCAQWSTMGCRAQLRADTNGRFTRIGASAHKHTSNDSRKSNFNESQFDATSDEQSTSLDGGTEILKHGGFTYKLHEKIAGRIVYICTYGAQCQAQVEADNYGDVITVVGDHSHDDDIKSNHHNKSDEIKTAKMSTKRTKQKCAAKSLNNSRIGVSHSKLVDRSRPDNAPRTIVYKGNDYVYGDRSKARMYYRCKYASSKHKCRAAITTDYETNDIKTNGKEHSH